YNRGQSRGKCYFEQAPPDITCATTGAFRVKGQTYSSLVDYFEKVYPKVTIDENGPAIKVSFGGIERPVWVPAERVFARVMNDNVPRSLQNVDKISPRERQHMVNAFWNDLGSRPLGQSAPGIRHQLWRPPAQRVHSLPLVDLIFGQNQRLRPPAI